MNTTGIADAPTTRTRPTPTARAGLYRLGLALAVFVLVVALLLMVALLPAAPASGSDTGAEIVSVEFDLGDGADGGSLQAIGPSEPISYRSVTVARADTEVRLRPVAEPAIASVASNTIDGFTAVSFGSNIDSAADRRAGDVALTVGSHYVHESGWYRGGEAATIRLTFSQPLPADGHLLVQEAAGDAPLRMAAVLADGTVVDGAATVGPAYDWDTGYPASTGENHRHWMSVVPVGLLPGSEGGIAGVSITVQPDSDLKVLPMSTVASLPVAGAATPVSTGDGAGPAPSQSGEDDVVDVQVADDQVSAPAFAAVGLTASFRSGTSPEGASCVQPAPADAAPVALPGEPATYCFAVTNLGSTPLTDVKISDPALGFADTVLPLASGPAQIAPGQTSVFYHHNTVGPRTSDAVSSVVATAIDAGGAALDGLVPPQAQSAELSVMVGTDQTAAGSSASATPAPSTGPTEADVTPSATQTGDGGGDAGASGGDAQADNEPQLAFTGPGLEPWVLVITALGFMFFGHAIMTAFRRSPTWAKLTGHAQLDAMGFE